MQALKGLCLALLSGVIYSFVGVIVKQMKNIHSEQLALYRFVFIFCFSLPQTVLVDESPIGPRKYRFFLILRGLVGGTGLSLSFLAFRYLSLGEANVIIFSAPVFVTIFARFFLKESCGALQVIAVLLTLVGIVLIAKLPQLAEGRVHAYTTENLYGLLAAFGAIIMNTSRFLILRKLKCVHQAVVMFNFGWVSMLETIILTALISGFKLHTCGLQPFFIITLGFFSYIEQLLLTIAMKYEQAGPVATARAATDIISAFLWQTFFFQEVPDAFSISGAILVSSSVVLVGLRKWVLSLPQVSKNLKYLLWLRI